MNGVAVKIDGVGRTFPNGVTALENICLAVAAGEFLAIVGPSGCGKSTLLRLVAKLDQPQTGSITLEPDDSHNLAFVFQDAQLLPWRNVLQNVAVPLELMHVPKLERLQAARGDRTGWTHRGDRSLSESAFGGNAHAGFPRTGNGDAAAVAADG